LSQFSKNIFNILIISSLAFFLYSYQIFKKTTIDINSEFQSIEIFVDSDFQAVSKLNEKINQYDDFVSYSYIDNSFDIKVYNSLKKKSIEELNVYEYLFRQSSIESLMKNMIDKQSANHFHNYSDIIPKFVDFLYYYISNSSCSKKLGKDLINELILLKNYNCPEKYKIVIKSNTKYLNQFEFQYEYEKFFNFLNGFDIMKIKTNKIKFYNNFLYQKYKKINKNDIDVEFKKCILCFSDNLDDVKNSFDALDEINVDYESESILDYIIINEIEREKYKLINRILINSSKYNDFSFDSNLSFSLFINLLKDFENLIFSNETFNNDNFSYKIKLIIDFFENKSSGFEYYYNLSENYNKVIEEHISYIANTEKFTQDRLSLYILNNYFKNEKYISKLFINQDDLKLVEAAFKFNTLKFKN
tara:strand:- start:140 stop:1390 length:1251 start_codon:yes stop_codon:yes gene_type:complete